MAVTCVGLSLNLWNCAGNLDFCYECHTRIEKRLVLAEVLVGPSVVVKHHPLYINCPVWKYSTNQGQAWLQRLDQILGCCRKKPTRKPFFSFIPFDFLRVLRPCFRAPFFLFLLPLPIYYARGCHIVGC